MSAPLAKSLSQRKETPTIQSLDRGLIILETVGRSPSPVSLSELTAILGIDRIRANFECFVPELRTTVMLSGCGHWTQQERPGEVSTAMIDFLRSLPS